MIDEFHLIYECGSLSQGKIYFINGAFYRFLYEEGSIKFPQYFFRPLPGQRKRADLKLNQGKVRRLVHETGIRAMKFLSITQTAIQLSLF